MALVHMSGLGMCDVTGLSVCIGKQSLSVCVCICVCVYAVHCGTCAVCAQEPYYQEMV